MKFIPQKSRADIVSKAGIADSDNDYEMIDSCDYCVFYFNKNYQPIVNQNRKNKMLLPKERNSGTKIAYLYAVKNGKKIINLYQ